MKIRRLIGLFLIVLAITQVFVSLSMQATSGHRRGLPYVIFISLMCTAGAVLLARGNGARPEA